MGNIKRKQVICLNLLAEYALPFVKMPATKNIENVPVMIRQLEKAVIENAFENGYVKQIVPESKSGKSVAVVGAGPSGLYMAF